MPFNLLKLTSISSSLHLHHRRQYWWLGYAIATGRSRTPPAMCSSWWRTTTCATPVYDNNSNDNNSNNRLGFRGQNNLRYSSKDKGGKPFNGGGRVSMGSVNNDNRDDKWTTENDRGAAVMSTLSSDNHRNLKSPASKQNTSTKFLTLPTILTIGRVAAIPVLVSTFYMNSRLGTTATTSIFIAAAITDWLDGYLARKMNLGTAFGAFLDPVADKLMVATTLVLLCTKPPEAAMIGQLPWLLTVPSIAVIGREITMSAVREWAASQGNKLSEAVAVNNLGKWKTATQMTSLTILLAVRDNSFTEVGLLGASGVALLYVSAGLAVWSLVVYMKKISKVMLM
ncbi:CDP-diacylglycerol--glycerol-3-phosphate 3-phosphatidyltransferase 2-like [Cynara cardunculus var. scolymus]|uniref:CDP-diacylglycerol--glycerol-3-phosphate 1-phosphatidyltransferase n=1 Tax=Cynara cardunculus var. scolymus TaxID=59895 RepID=A0A103Y9F3_CYNCS|nr:CDP-diacylglycerol--glycerol-3-phosphate 3-phosphatidyltransferase 2-like [Cynara cardunculus var. scolymus]KVI04964.1 CDP-alcohol phosphatidyltransferase [Cynara cardunculus var. scolymus]